MSLNPPGRSSQHTYRRGLWINAIFDKQYAE